MRRLFALSVALLVMTSPQSVLARQATPAATPGIPLPEACQVAPRRPASLLGIQGTPTAGTLPEAGGYARATRLPAGKPVDPPTAKAIEATVRELYACINAGEQLRALALYSDDYFRRLVAAGGPLNEEFVESLATPQPPPQGQQLPAPDLAEIRVLDDERVGALVTLDGQEDGNDAVPFFIFVEADDRWLIDEIIEIEPERSAEEEA